MALDEGGCLVAVAGDEQLVGDAAGKLAGQFGTFLQADAADWDER